MNDQTNAMPFDADSFMNETVDGAMSTTLATIPDGEYRTVVGDFDSSAFKTVNTKNGPRQVLEVPFVLQDDEVKAKMKREQVVHKETYWLDFDENGKLSKGDDHNVRLGQLRKALGQNEAGVPWAPAMLRNMGPLMIAIKTTTDKNDPEKKYTNITKYAKIS